MTLQKNYGVKDVNMLFASQNIVSSARDNQAELQTVHTTCTVEYLDGLEARIKEAINQYAGLDRYNALRISTNELQQVTTPAWNDLSFIRMQIKVLFDKESEFILKELGLGNYKRMHKQSGQQQLSALLMAFRRGMSDELQTRLEAKGISNSLIMRLKHYGEAVIEFNNKQEKAKQSTKALNREARTFLNEIYSDIITLCKIAAAYYKEDPLKRELFTFSKVIKQLSHTASSQATVLEE